MNPKAPDDNYRLNSPARIKRRAKTAEKAEASGALLHSDKENEAPASTQPTTWEANVTTGKRQKNKSSDAGAHTRSGIRFDERSWSVEKPTTSSQASKGTRKEISTHPDHSFITKGSHSEKLSGSSQISIETIQLQTSGTDLSKKENTTPLKQSKKIKTLATLLPDEILNDPVSRKYRSYFTAVMFPDVSGFTQLCEKYDKTGKGGPSRLTEVLNGYIGSMIQIVLSRNGDVCKFGGDAFLCFWKASDDFSIVEIVHLAIESAVDIQKNCGEHKTDVGVKLGVKIAVAAGKALFSIIGTDARKHYVIFGPPVIDVRDAEHLCKPGDVIVAPSAWKYVDNYMLYSYTYHLDNNHIRVHDFGPLWKSARSDLTPAATNPRPFLRYSLRLKVEDLRPFILPAVMKSIDLNQSLDYLTEMRQVAIVFLNLAADYNSMAKEDVIELSNISFKIVTAVVDKFDGTVNKLTLFDKDMAILLVFGLKGFKHELASQVALKCAYGCVEQLKKLQVVSASAGVTTGMAYCGVIGHTLRKEYTVMGRPVNLAARLMCAYENMVSCDRDTFLHSKLESGHFELLEHKSLKGIQTPGPFYKFHMHPKRNKLKLDFQAYPLLGRAKEIQEFEKFLSNSNMSDNKTNFMVIFGQARIGKSRLVARLINIAEKTSFEDSQLNLRKRHRSSSNRIDVCIIPLTEDDSKSSHTATRLIFLLPLGLSDASSSVEEREDKILAKLGDQKDISLLAALNPIFNVNYDLMPQYLALSQQEQSDIQKIMLRNLYKKCFPKGVRWLMVIEDAEFMDEESWNFLKWCSHESYTVLYLMTIGQHRPLPPAALSCLDSIKYIKITLTEIEKWYYSGLACQILGVKAIPVELVNLIQTYKSSGNPGWLESFLLSLIQSGSIYVDQASPNEMKKMKLVSPPEEMLSISKTTEDEKYDSSYWLDCLENFEQIGATDHSSVPVCLLGPNFYDCSENDAELTMDIMFIKTIDTLKPLEQLVLKAGSVLGNNFKRAALKYVLSSDAPIDERPLAKAIRNLFVIKILTCAKGDLTQSNILAPRRMILVSSLRKEVVCECTGLVISDETKDLPRYANCGYMQFRSPTLRDTVYNLLLDDQKKKFHSSCIEFLRTNTYKCKFCLNVPFDNVFGYEVDNQVTLVCAKSPMHGVRSTKLEPTTNFPIPSLAKRWLKRFSTYVTMQIRESSQYFEREIGSISNSDVGDCQCSEILASVYSVLLEHSAGSGRKDIMLEVLLEYASVSLTSYNIPLTMQLLEEALALVNQMKEEKEYPEFCTPYVFCKIYALMGATKLSMGRPDNALEFLEKSLQYMKRSLPKGNVKTKLLIQREKMRQKLIMEDFPERYIGKASAKIASISDLMSECLGLITMVHIYMQKWLTAKYTSLWALNKALDSNRNFYGLCMAYTNMMDIAYHENDVVTCAKMEVCAIDVCRRCTKRVIEGYELEAICRLYRVIFQTRLVRAEIEEAVLIGFESIRIASVIRSSSLRVELMPDLIFALIQLNRLSEAVSLLQELEFMSLVDSDKSSRMWYFAICMDFQLDTGFTVIPYETCQQFVRDEEEALMVVQNSESKHRLYTSLWLWCLRNDEWELSKPYAKILKTIESNEPRNRSERETPSSVLTRLKRLEGYLITLVHRMDTRNIYSITSTYSDIHGLLSKLKNETKTLKLLRPRYLLLKAYYRQIKYRDDSYHKILNQAQYLAEKMKDINTTEWIVHVNMVWSNAISPIQRDYWVEHCRNNLIDWHESEGSTNKQTFMYSLSLPRF